MDSLVQDAEDVLGHRARNKCRSLVKSPDTVPLSSGGRSYPFPFRFILGERAGIRLPRAGGWSRARLSWEGV